VTTSSLASTGQLAASDDAADGLSAAFSRAGARGFVHAVDLDSGRLAVEQHRVLEAVGSCHVPDGVEAGDVDRSAVASGTLLELP
jgi:hypothetical protein